MLGMIWRLVYRLIGPISVLRDIPWVLRWFARLFWGVQLVGVLLVLLVCPKRFRRVAVIAMVAWAAIVGFAAQPRERVVAVKRAYSCPAGSSCSSVPLRIMSVNLRGADIDDGDDSWWPPGGDAGPGARPRSHRLHNVITDQHPDVVGTQEGGYAQLHDLEMLGYGSLRWAGAPPDSDKPSPTPRFDDSAILYAPHRVALLWSRTIWLSDTPDVPGSKVASSSHARTATCALFRRLDNEKPLTEPASPQTPLFWVCNTHLDHASEAARRDQARILLRWLQTLRPAGQPGADFDALYPGVSWQSVPLVLTGDFNALRHSEAWNTLTACDTAADGGGVCLRDPRLSVVASATEPELTFHAFMGGELESGWFTTPLRVASTLCAWAGRVVPALQALPCVAQPRDLHVDWILHSAAPSPDGSTTTTSTRSSAPTSVAWNNPQVRVVTDHDDASPQAPSRGVRYPSDHYPVLFTADLCTTPSN